MKNLNILSSCLNVTSLDNLFETACCSLYDASTYSNIQSIIGDELYNKCNSHAYNSMHKCPLNSLSQPYLPTGTYLSNSNCNPIEMQKKESVYLNSVFDCTSLPICKITCVGPEKTMINKVTKSCSCMSEWLLNSYFIQIMMALFVYFMLNISRIMIGKGLVMIIWRSIAKEEFEVKTSCSRSGKIQSSLLNNDDNKNDQKYDEISNKSYDDYDKNDDDNIIDKNDDNNKNDDNKYDEDEESVKLTDTRNVRRDYDDQKNDTNYSNDEHIFAPNYFSSTNNAEKIRKSNDYENQMIMINEGIEVMLWRFVLKGYIYLILGILLNFGWLIAIMQAKQNIVYKPV